MTKMNICTTKYPGKGKFFILNIGTPVGRGIDKLVESSTLQAGYGQQGIKTVCGST